MVGPATPQFTYGKERYDSGRIPLHMACGFEQSLEVIQFLVQQNPDTLKVKDKVSCLPLHLACTHEKSFEVIEFQLSPG